MALLALAACGGPGPSATASPSPPTREMNIVVSGALSGPFQLTTSSYNSCATHLADDPHSVNYIFEGHVEGSSPDVSFDVNFSVRRYPGPGTFTVGAYPAGSATAPAIASVVREITARNIVSWISGSGSLVIDIGARSGKLDLHLSSASGLGELGLSGTWLCPPGS